MLIRQKFQRDLSLPLPKKLIIDTHGGILDLEAIIASYHILEKTNPEI